MYLVAKAPAELQPLGSAGLQGETSAGERNIVVKLLETLTNFQFN